MVEQCGSCVTKVFKLRGGLQFVISELVLSGDVIVTVGLLVYTSAC